MGNAQNIFIYGAPGAGKTTLSIALHKCLARPVVEGDYLREVVAQKEKTEQDDPFVHVGVKEAFRRFGELTEEHVIKGLKAVRRSMAPYVASEIAKHRGDLILEAAFLDPQEIKRHGRLILVTTSDEQKHRNQYFAQRVQDQDHAETFQAARMIQAYLIEEAKAFPVTIVDNDTDVKTIITKLDDRKS